MFSIDVYCFLLVLDEHVIFTFYRDEYDILKVNDSKNHVNIEVAQFFKGKMFKIRSGVSLFSLNLSCYI